VPNCSTCLITHFSYITSCYNQYITSCSNLWCSSRHHASNSAGPKSSRRHLTSYVGILRHRWASYVIGWHSCDHYPRHLPQARHLVLLRHAICLRHSRRYAAGTLGSHALYHVKGAGVAPSCFPILHASAIFLRHSHSPKLYLCHQLQGGVASGKNGRNLGLTCPTFFTAGRSCFHTYLPYLTR